MKKVFSILFTSLFFLTAVSAQEMQDKEGFVSFGGGALCFEVSCTKPMVADNLDSAFYGASFQVDGFHDIFGLKMGFDWQYINDTNYLPFEVGFNLHLPLSFKNTVCLDPHAGVAADICLWNDNPIYGFSWMGCIRLTIPAWFVGFSVYYKHSYYFPIRRTDSKVDVGKLGIGFQIYLDESGF